MAADVRVGLGDRYKSKATGLVVRVNAVFPNGVNVYSEDHDACWSMLFSTLRRRYRLVSEPKEPPAPMEDRT